MRGGCTSRPGEANVPKMHPKHPFSIFNPTPAEATPPPHTSDLALPLLTSFARTGLAQDTNKNAVTLRVTISFVTGVCALSSIYLERPSAPRLESAVPDAKDGRMRGGGG